MNPQSSSTFSQEPNLESAMPMVVKCCSQSMIDRFRMSQSTMNLARQDSGEVSNKAENVERTKIQKRLKIGQHKFWPIFGLKVLLRKCKMYLGQGMHCLTKTLFCAYLQNNLHKWTQIFATLPPKNRDVHSIAKSRTGATLFYHLAPTMVVHCCNNGRAGAVHLWLSRRFVVLPPTILICQIFLWFPSTVYIFPIFHFHCSDFFHKWEFIHFSWNERRNR